MLFDPPVLVFAIFSADGRIAALFAGLVDVGTDQKASMLFAVSTFLCVIMFTASASVISHQRLAKIDIPLKD